MKSTATNVTDAVAKIGEMTEASDISDFIEGDDRKTVVDAAHNFGWYTCGHCC